jgi:hypothetical protein
LPPSPYDYEKWKQNLNPDWSILVRGGAVTPAGSHGPWRGREEPQLSSKTSPNLSFLIQKVGDDANIYVTGFQDPSELIV